MYQASPISLLVAAPGLLADFSDIVAGSLLPNAFLRCLLLLDGLLHTVLYVLLHRAYKNMSSRFADSCLCEILQGVSLLHIQYIFCRCHPLEELKVPSLSFASNHKPSL